MVSHWLCELNYFGTNHVAEITNIPNRKSIIDPNKYKKFIEDNIENELPIHVDQSIPSQIYYCLDCLKHSIRNLKNNSKKVPIHHLQAPEDFSKTPKKRVKLKVTKNNYIQEVNWIEQGISKSEESRIILDLNQGLGLKEFKELIELLSDKNIKENILYIEEPLAEGEDILKIPDNTTFQIAIDERFEEALKTFDSEDQINNYFSKFKNGPISHLVIKPSSVGSWKKIRMIKDIAARYNIETVLSSGFESNVGILYLCELYKYLELENSAGLGTIPLLASHQPNPKFSYDQTSVSW